LSGHGTLAAGDPKRPAEEKSMNRKARQRARALVRLLAGEEYERLIKIEIRASEFGYDPFGLERESAMLAFALLHFVYKHWFRVESLGVEQVPLEGPVLLASNHGGGIPIDGAMIALDLATKMEKPRFMRSVVDNFAGSLPFVNLFFHRCGQVIGARRNLVDLLEQGEMIAVFPEGHNGTGKKFSDRYKLLPFNVGFVELSLLHRTPIIPTAVIGAEEQYPYLIHLERIAKVLNLPYVPIPPLSLLLGPVGCLPLPTKYQIYYGEPIRLYLDHPADTVKDPEMIRRLAAQVRDRVIELVADGLGRREGVFNFSRPVLQQVLPDSIRKRAASAWIRFDRATARRRTPEGKRAGKEPVDRWSERTPDPVEEIARSCSRLESTLEQRTRELETAIAALEREIRQEPILRVVSPLPGVPKRSTPSLSSISQMRGTGPLPRVPEQSSSRRDSTPSGSGAFPVDPHAHSGPLR
jgi:1-acyl-sn-glycerol-3-phosphate acyltransferase